MDERKHRVELLSEKDRERLLKRAIEIDAARGTPIVHLRDAAAEAGISREAFDQAVAELEQEKNAVATPTQPRRYAKIALSVGLGVAVAIGFSVMRVAGPTYEPAQPATEQSFTLNCLSPEQAAEALRQVLRSSGTIVTSGPDSRTIIVRGTEWQVERSRDILAARDPAGAACPAPAR